MLSYVKKEVYGMPFDQKKYVNSYNKETYKMFPFRVRRDNKAIMEKLESEKNVNSYILKLIDNDVNPGVLTIKQIKERILPIANKYNIHDIYLFGSYARGEATNQSDVDIYCESGDVRSFDAAFDFEGELKNALNKDVDVIYFSDRINDFFKEQLDIDKIKLC